MALRIAVIFRNRWQERAAELPGIPYRIRIRLIYIYYSLGS